MSEPALLYAELGQYTSHYQLRGIEPAHLMELSKDPKIAFLASISAKLSGKFVFFQTRHGAAFMVTPYKKELDRSTTSGYQIPEYAKSSVDAAYKAIFDRALPMGPIWDVPVAGETSWQVELLVEATSERDAERIAKSYLNALTDQERQDFLIKPQETQLFHDLYNSECAEGAGYRPTGGAIKEDTRGYIHITFETPCDS